jgi:hypothetical protein
MDGRGPCTTVSSFVCGSFAATNQGDPSPSAWPPILSPLRWPIV